ncbi:MAG: class I SAM-dependent methyltransferase [Candidatus Eisenbacteria bacterium]|uniref:Class I SAM-dependent methyltransferase n=1 Tax=Eiseniibacteriota bacterium TaxID=2212470 RepID=A0A849SSH6_UNCEI|nr:class I SAM-dependent methyltransferase [Candidatus Eisenbacteria bacterium]
MSYAHTTPYFDAELYDLSYAWYDADRAFYVGESSRAGGPVLEVGCGSGRLLIPAAAAGADIDGIDLEPAMLDLLRAKAARAGLTPHVAQADMRDFTLPRRYALITIPFRALLHNLTAEDQLATLRCCREHLAPGGRLLLNLFFPSMAFIQAKDGVPQLEREFTHPESMALVKMESTTHYDRVRQTLTTDRTVTETPASSAPRVHRYAFTLRWIWKAEMELLLRAAGFERFEVRGGFEGAPFERDDQEMVWTAWRE